VKNLVEQISLRFGVFLLKQDEFNTNYAVDKHAKKSVKISMKICIMAYIQKVI